MPDHHNDHDQQDQQNHDDCEDCRRQRAENDQLIAIYEKLQQVDKRTSDMKGSIVLHQQQVDKSKEVLNTFDQKVNQVRVEKGDKNVTQFEEIGYNLYADALINSKKSEAQKQNQRLKLMLKKIYQEKGKLTESVSIEKPKLSLQIPPALPPVSQKQSSQWFQKGNLSSRTQSRTSKSFLQTSMEKSFEIFSTKSSFNMTKRKVFQKKDFEQLNLWLFEQRNEILQKQLYESQPKQPLTSTQREGSLKKGMQRYINNAKNATRLGASTVMRNSIRKQNSLTKRETKDAFNNSSLGSDYAIINKSKIQTLKDIQPEQNSNSGRFFNRRPIRGSVLPAISSK